MTRKPISPLGRSARKLLTLALLGASAAGCGGVLESADSTGPLEETVTRDAPLRAVSNTWPGGVVNFCWEVTTNSSPERRAWTVEAFESTWGRAANLKLVDHGDCNSYRARYCSTLNDHPCDAVQINFTDTVTAPSAQVGRFLHTQGTMWLNPDFKYWSQSCAGDVEFCFKGRYR